jgi:hypothetical protein
MDFLLQTQNLNPIMSEKTNKFHQKGCLTKDLHKRSFPQNQHIQIKVGQRRPRGDKGGMAIKHSVMSWEGAWSRRKDIR